MKSLVKIGLLVLFVGVTFSLCAQDAAEIYGKKCKSCHGKVGEGNSSLAKALKVEAESLSLLNMEKSDDELIAITKDGKGKMPAYKDKLSDEEIGALVGVMRAFSE